MSQQPLLSLTFAPELASPLSKYEQERLQRIETNRRRMEELGVLETVCDLLEAAAATKPPRPQKQHRKPRGLRPRPADARRSARLTGDKPQYGGVEGDWEEPVSYSDAEGGGLDDLLAGDDDVSHWEPAKQERFQELRCNSLGRGSVYDQHIGITCHFCRQKKLCGEDGCPRCSRRSASAACIGKTECARCQSATGRICRACLLLRYGQTMEGVQSEMAAGTWLCPHCYEAEHPEEGWMCNSSICMKRRGFKPTGIAIYDAQQRGFASVAHWLQAQIKRRGGAAAALLDSGSAGGAGGGGGGAAAPKCGRRVGSVAAAAGLEEGAAGIVGPGGARRPRKGADAAIAAAAARLDATPGGSSDQDASRRRTRAAVQAAAAAAAALSGGGAKAWPLEGTKRDTRASASAGGESAAAAGAAPAASKDAVHKTAKQAETSKHAAAPLGKAGTGAAAAGVAKKAPANGATAPGAPSSCEGSSEPFAPATPAKRSAKPTAAGGAQRSLRQRRI